MDVLGVGMRVLMPCEVKPGPFDNERLVRVRTDHVDWMGFVPTAALREPIETGETYVAVCVTSISGGQFTARVPGSGFRSDEFRASGSRVVHA